MGNFGVDHVPVRTPAGAPLKNFCVQVLDRQPSTGAHEPVQPGTVLIACSESNGRPAEEDGLLAEPGACASRVTGGDSL